jgi:hypothetical protein
MARVKSQDETFEMIHTRIPEKAIKGFLLRKGEP